MDIRMRRASAALAAAFGTIFAPLALAGPTVGAVSGTLSAGQTVTIAGSGFGSKPTAAPVLWDNFENGTVGGGLQGAPAAIGTWDTGAGSENVSYSNKAAHSGKQAADHNFVTAYNASLAKNMTFTRLYMDFWMVADYNSIQSRNFKPWRLYGDNDNYQLDYVWLCNSNLMNRVQANTGFSVGDYGGPPYANGQWMHFQVTYQQSSPGQADGAVHHFINSQVAGLDSNSVETETASASFSQIRLGHYWDSNSDDACPSNAGAHVYVDDAYIDTSWARVEIGNAPAYADSTHREIQVAKTWSDGSVTVSFNPGSFSAGSTAYVFVTDPNGNTSAGKPITLGGSSGGGGTPPVRPNPPTNVTVE
jgi:hypothetical protein